MRGSLRKSSVMAVALATGTVLVGAGLMESPAQAQNRKGKDQGNSPEFVAVAGPLLEKVNAAVAAQQAQPGGGANPQVDAALAGAPEMLAQAEAVAKTPRDKLTVGQMVMQMGILKNDSAMAQRGIRTMLATGQLDAAQTAQMQQTLQKLTATPQADPVMTQVNALAQANNPRGALAELRKAVSGQSAGQRAPAAYYARATQIAVSNNIADEALYWSARQVEHYPSNQNWLAATQTVKQFGALDPQERLDLYRLMSRSGAFNNDARFVASEYLDYADMANLRGFYGEAVRVIDQGRSAGALNATQGAQIRTAANARAAADRASLAAQERDARTAATGVPALAAADVNLSFGDSAKAEELYRLALQKGGVDKDRALTRLGIAQFDQGKYAGAQESFSQVTGARRLPVARLWLTLTAQKDPSAVPRRAS